MKEHKLTLWLAWDLASSSAVAWSDSDDLLRTSSAPRGGCNHKNLLLLKCKKNNQRKKEAHGLVLSIVAYVKGNGAIIDELIRSTID